MKKKTRKSNVRRQFEFEPINSERPSGWKKGDQFEIVKIRPISRGSDRTMGDWWRAEKITVRPVVAAKTRPECEACGRPAKLDSHGHCKVCARWRKSSTGK